MYLHHSPHPHPHRQAQGYVLHRYPHADYIKLEGGTHVSAHGVVLRSGREAQIGFEKCRQSSGKRNRFAPLWAHRRGRADISLRAINKINDMHCTCTHKPAVAQKQKQRHPGTSKWLRACRSGTDDGTNFKVAASRHVEWAANEAQTTVQKHRTGQSSSSQLCGCAATGSRAPTSCVC